MTGRVEVTGWVEVTGRVEITEILSSRQAYPVIPPERSDEGSQTTNSRHSGFILSTSRFFFSLRHFLISFSLDIAEKISLVRS